MMHLPQFFFLSVSPLIAMAFFTLVERKILAYSQLRKGPNKTSIMGLPQPLADALNLFTNELVSPTNSNRALFLLFPIIALLLALILWALYPIPTTNHFFSFSVVSFIAISSLSVYPTLGIGWASNSNYALLGAIRSIAQTISYEVSISLIILFFIFKLQTFDLLGAVENSQFTIIFLAPPLSIIWLAVILAEANRAPFDFTEGESELVSGFNTEYSSRNFALIFIAEYTSILFLCALTSIFLFMPPLGPFLVPPTVSEETVVNIIPRTLINFNIPILTPVFAHSGPSLIESCSAVSWPSITTADTPPTWVPLLLLLPTTVSALLVILIRATLPRIRYDRLMAIAWNVFLPSTLTALFLVCSAPPII